MKKNTGINLGVWAGLVVFTAIGMTLMNYSSVRTGGAMKSTEGSVIGYVPGEQPSYRYLYTVNGRSFQGSAKPTERVEQMKLGGSIAVFYDESNPANSSLSAPSTMVVKRMGLIVAVCIAFPVLVMWILQARQLLPPWKLFQDLHEWVAARFAAAARFVESKRHARSKIAAGSQKPA